MRDTDSNMIADSNGTITIPISDTINPIKVGMCVDLDNLPVSIIKDGITYDVEDYINMLIDRKLNAEAESNNPCSNCMEFDCTYCKYESKSKHNPCYDCQNDFDCHNCKYEYLQA